MTTPISGQVIYCTQPVCRSSRRRNPATMLISWYDKPGEPTCDRCARGAFDVDVSGQLSLAPLDGYQPVDLFTEAKQAAFATPGQVISGEPAATAAPEQITKPVIASTALDDKVVRRIWADQKVYCRVHWCEESQRLTPATQRLNPVGGFWCPACQECIDKSDPSQVEIAPMSEEDTASLLQMVSEYAKDQHWSEPTPVSMLGPIIGTGVASVIAGIITCLVAAPDGTVSGSTPNIPAMIVGVLLIAIPVLAGGAALVVLLGQAIIGGIRKERAWKATLTPEQRLGVEVAETAAAFATWGAVHEGIKHLNARQDAHTATVRANLEHGRQLGKAQDQQAQQNQMAADLRQLASQDSQPQYPRVPGPTIRSDIYGNPR